MFQFYLYFANWNGKFGYSLRNPIDRLHKGINGLNPVDYKLPPDYNPFNNFTIFQFTGSEISGFKIEKKLVEYSKNREDFYHVKTTFPKDYKCGTEVYVGLTPEIIIEFFESLKPVYKFEYKTMKPIDFVNNNPRWRRKNRRINNAIINASQTIIKPTELQKTIIKSGIDYFDDIGIDTKKSGMLVLPCGIGKTYISLFICEILKQNRSKKNFNVLIGVPGIINRDQFIKSVKNIFLEKSNICTNIGKFKPESEINVLVICYASAYKVLESGFEKFDLVISDEAHHIKLGSEDKPVKIGKGKYSAFGLIPYTYRLFLTATPNKSCEIPVIYRIGFSEAIDRKIITNYRIMIIDMPESERVKIAHLFGTTHSYTHCEISAYTTLIAIKENKVNRCLIVANKKSDADLINQYINILKTEFRISVFNTALHSDMETGFIKRGISDFKEQKKSIIVSVNMFNEGIDLPECDGVVFADIMKSSVRIVQTACRANRKHTENPEKIATYIIPALSDKKKLRNADYIIKSLTEIFEEDKNVSDKIEAYRINSDAGLRSESGPMPVPVPAELSLNLDKKLMHRIRLIILEQTKNRDRLFKFVKNVMKDFQMDKKIEIKTESKYNKIKTEFLDYINCRSLDHKIDPEIILEPETYFAGQWTNWYDFLNIDTSRYVKTVEEWRKLVNAETNIDQIDEKMYKKLSKKFHMLPPDPEEYFKKIVKCKFTNLISELCGDILFC